MPSDAQVGEVEEYDNVPYHGGVSMDHRSRSVIATCYHSVDGSTWSNEFFGSNRKEMVRKAEDAWRQHVLAWFVETRFVTPFPVAQINKWVDDVVGDDVGRLSFI